MHPVQHLADSMPCPALVSAALAACSVLCLLWPGRSLLVVVVKWWGVQEVWTQVSVHAPGLGAFRHASPRAVPSMTSGALQGFEASTATWHECRPEGSDAPAALTAARQSDGLRVGHRVRCGVRWRSPCDPARCHPWSRHGIIMRKQGSAQPPHNAWSPTQAAATLCLRVGCSSSCSGASTGVCPPVVSIVAAVIPAIAGIWVARIGVMPACRAWVLQVSVPVMHA